MNVEPTCIDQVHGCAKCLELVEEDLAGRERDTAGTAYTAAIEIMRQLQGGAEWPPSTSVGLLHPHCGNAPMVTDPAQGDYDDSRWATLTLLV